MVFCDRWVTLANRKVLGASLGFSSGVMLYVSFVEIFNKSVIAFQDCNCLWEDATPEDPPYIMATVCFFGGLVLTMLLDVFVHWLSHKGGGELPGHEHGHGHGHGHSHSHGHAHDHAAAQAPLFADPNAAPLESATEESRTSAAAPSSKPGTDGRKKSSDVDLETFEEGDHEEEQDEDKSALAAKDSFQFPAPPTSPSDVHVVELDELAIDDAPQTHGHAHKVAAAGTEAGDSPVLHGLAEGRDPAETVEAVTNLLGAEAAEALLGAGDGDEENKQKLNHMGIMTAVALGVHNFPEGLATFVSALADPRVGFGLAVAIAIHNIPEGLCVSIPVYYSTGSRWRGFWLAFFSGVTEIIGAGLGYGFLMALFSDAAYAILFGIVAGMMVAIVIKELLPTAHRYDPNDALVTNFVALGMLIMAVSLVLFKVDVAL